LHILAERIRNTHLGNFPLLRNLSLSETDFQFPSPVAFNVKLKTPDIGQHFNGLFFALLSKQPEKNQREID